MNQFELRIVLAWGLFLTFLVIAFFVIIVRKLRKAVIGQDERETPDFVLENIRNTLAQRQQMSETLQQRETLNAIILQHVDLGIAIFDRFKVMKSANPMFLKLFQLAETATGESIVQWKEQAPSLFRFIRDLKWEARQAEYTAHWENRNRSLRVRAVQVDAMESGVQGYLLIAEDTTEMETAKRQLELKQRLEMLGEMSAGLAHEFRNALSTLKGYAQMIRSESTDDLNEHASRILTEVDEIDQLVGQFLLYAKPLHVQPESFSGSDLKADLRPLISLPDERVELDIPDALSFHTDRRLLRQCLDNLIRNSIAHMDDSDSRLQITATKSENRLIITVRDEGTGMDNDTLSRACIPFFTGRTDGTGLGLAICEKIIIRLGGAMRLDSAPGAGTSVTITL